MSILSKDRSFTANSGTKAAVLLKGRSSTANSGTQAAVLLGIDRCGSFPLLSAPHSLFSIWTDLKRSEKIPGPPTWRWGEWIWLTGPSGLHWNSPQGLNISSISFWPDQRSGNHNQPSSPKTIICESLYRMSMETKLIFWKPQNFGIFLRLGFERFEWRERTKISVFNLIYTSRFIGFEYSIPNL